MNRIARIAAAFAAGAAVMYYLDPLAGRRRRALVRDRGLAATHDAERFVRAKSHRAADRARGMLARARSTLADAPVDDDRLHERIRARLGRVVAHPGQVNVDVNHGHVVLRGRASPGEIETLTETLSVMRGVCGVDNRISTGSGQARV